MKLKTSSFSKFEIYERDRLLCVVTKSGHDFFANIVEDSIMHPIKSGTLSYKEITNFFKDRIFSSSRPDRNWILEELGIPEYNEVDIIKKTHGILFQDCIWIRFDDEEYSWEDVREILYG